MHERACSDCGLGKCFATVLPVATFAATTHVAAREWTGEHHHWHAWRHGLCKYAPNLLINETGSSRVAFLCPQRTMQPCSRYLHSAA